MLVLSKSNEAIEWLPLNNIHQGSDVLNYCENQRRYLGKFDRKPVEIRRRLCPCLIAVREVDRSSGTNELG